MYLGFCMNLSKLYKIEKKAYQSMIDEDRLINEGSIQFLIVEGLNDDEKSELVHQTGEAHNILDRICDCCPESMKNTMGYVKNLRQSLPSKTEIVKLELDGRRSEVARRVSHIVSVIDQVNNLLTSFEKLSGYMGKVTNALSDGTEGVLSTRVCDYLDTENPAFDAGQFDKIAKKSLCMSKKGVMQKVRDYFSTGEPVVMLTLPEFTADIRGSTFGDMCSLNTGADSAEQLKDEVQKIEDKITPVTMNPEDEEPEDTMPLQPYNENDINDDAIIIERWKRMAGVN